MANPEEIPLVSVRIAEEQRTVTRPWKRWFDNMVDSVVTKTDKVDPATADNVASLDSDGNLKDSGIPSADVLEPKDVDGTTDQVTVTDDGDGTITVSLPNPLVTPGPATVTGNLTVVGDIDADSITVDAYERHIQVPVLPVGNPASQPTAVDVGTAGGYQFASSGTQEELHFQWEVPDDWDGTDIRVEIDWCPDSGAMTAPDTISWVFQYRSIAEGELITQGTIAVETINHSTTTPQYTTVHSPVTFPFNDADQPLTKQDHLYVRCYRDTTVGNDFAGTVVATAFEILYNSTTLPTSN